MHSSFYCLIKLIALKQYEHWHRAAKTGKEAFIEQGCQPTHLRVSELYLIFGLIYKL